MKCAIVGVAIVVAAVGSAVAADQTWIGKISDGVCGGDTHIGGAFGRRMSARDCTLACVRSGASYVFVVGAQVYAIANQHEPALAIYAGQTVMITGEMNGHTITVSKVETPKKSQQAVSSDR